MIFITVFSPILAIDINSPTETVATDSNVENPASMSFWAVEGPTPGRSVIPTLFLALASLVLSSAVSTCSELIQNLRGYKLGYYNQKISIDDDINLLEECERCGYSSPEELVDNIYEIFGIPEEDRLILNE